MCFSPNTFTVGTGARSERIRTYNYPQSRLTDHRANWSTKNIEMVMEGGEALDEVLCEVWEAMRREMIEKLIRDANEEVGDGGQ